VLEAVKTGKLRIRVYNDSPYARMLEYGDGHTRPPHAMLRRAMMDFKGFVERGL
jgi:hypothetical protein